MQNSGGTLEYLFEDIGPPTETTIHLCSFQVSRASLLSNFVHVDLEMISIETNNRLRQELEGLAITPVWQGNKRPIWQPRKDQTRKDQDSTLVSDPQHLELQSTSLSSTEDENELEDDEADDCEYSDSDLSDHDISSTPGATCLSGMDVELFSEKEDWEKELNEAYPYDDDDLEIIFRKSYCEGPLIWQDGEMYNPSHDHAPSSRTNIVEIPIVQGQFDDADE